MPTSTLGNFEQTTSTSAGGEGGLRGVAQGVHARDAQPLQWAFAQNNLGDVHWSMPRGGGKADYEKAIELFESAKAGFTQAGYLPLIGLTDKKIALVKQALAKE